MSDRATTPVRSVLRGVWRNPELRRLQLAYGNFNVAEMATWLATLVFAYDRGGATEAGVLATGLFVPGAIFAPLLASVGERRPPGRFLLVGFLAQAATGAAVAAAMLADAPSLLVFFLLAVDSVAYTVTRPGQAALAPALARTPEELTATNVVSGWIESVSAFIGPLLVGVLLTVSSPGALFAVGAVLAVGAAAFVRPLRAAPTAPAGDGDSDGGSAPLRESIDFVRRDGTARILLFVLGAQWVAVGALELLYVELARAVLHRGGNWAGYLNAAYGVGSILVVVVTARLVGERRLAVPLVLSVVGWSVALFGLAGTPGIVAAVLWLGVAGGARTTFDVTGRTLLQRIARPDMLARVFGLLEGLQTAGYAVGALLAPALIALGGARAAFAGVGLILPLVALSGGRRLLDIDRHATVPVVQIALLRNLTMFALLPPPTIEALAHSLVPVEIPGGVDVFTQGETGDRFFVVADGELEVITDGAAVRTLSRGDGFGEIALLYDVPRTAGVRTRSDSRLYALEREIFIEAVTGHPSSHAAARGLADSRLADSGSLRVPA